jgi:hypothetical protein
VCTGARGRLGCSSRSEDCASGLDGALLGWEGELVFPESPYAGGSVPRVRKAERGSTQASTHWTTASSSCVPAGDRPGLHLGQVPGRSCRGWRHFCAEKRGSPQQGRKEGLLQPGTTRSSLEAS